MAVQRDVVFVHVGTLTIHAHHSLLRGCQIFNAARGVIRATSFD
jgi:hypothetical protein